MAVWQKRVKNNTRLFALFSSNLMQEKYSTCLAWSKMTLAGNSCKMEKKRGRNKSFMFQYIIFALSAFAVLSLVYASFTAAPLTFMTADLLIMQFNYLYQIADNKCHSAAVKINCQHKLWIASNKMALFQFMKNKISYRIIKCNKMSPCIQPFLCLPLFETMLYNKLIYF